MHYTYNNNFFFYKATQSNKTALAVITTWTAIQAVVSISGFYTTENTLPPRFALAVLPPLIFITIIFITKTGRTFMDSLDVRALTLVHIIRIPVELVLLWLYMHKAVPELMTFEGRNLDILSGITAPLIYYFVFIKNSAGKNVLIIWNFICLALLINIAFNAFLSVPTAFQKFAFEQPNVALLYFPFTMLPSVIVPLVMFSHLASIRKIIKQV